MRTCDPPAYRAGNTTPFMQRITKLLAVPEPEPRPDEEVDAEPRVRADLLKQSANKLVGEAREQQMPMRKQLYDEAIRSYTEADRLLPDSFEILYFLAAAIAENAQNKMDQRRSVEMMTRSVNLEPRWDENRQALGAVLEIAGRKDEAEEQRAIAHTLSQSLSAAYNYAEKGELANSLWSFGLGCPARLCVQGIYPLSPQFSSFVAGASKSDGTVASESSGTEPVALVYRDALAPALLSTLKATLQTREGGAFFYGSEKRYNGRFVSWWFPVNIGTAPPQPASAMDELVRLIARDLLPKSAQQHTIGAELWGHDRPRFGKRTKANADGNHPAHFLHFDEDGPHSRDSGEYLHPLYTALVYLSDVGGLTVIINQTRTSPLATHAWVVPPQNGQVTVFQSSRLHGALPEISVRFQ